MSVRKDTSLGNGALATPEVTNGLHMMLTLIKAFMAIAICDRI